MQLNSVIFQKDSYNPLMPAGRPSKSKRNPFGERLCNARLQKGFSQMQMAQLLGVTQPSYADWERHPVSLRPEHISQLAKILNVSVDYLLGHSKTNKRNGGPVGKARAVFERVSQLPRHRQKKIVEVVEALVGHHGNGVAHDFSDSP